MIHYSAHNGSPIISGFAFQALRDVQAPLPLPGATLGTTYASAVSTIFAATSSILNADAAQRGTIGGSVFDGERVAVLGEDIATQVLGLLAVWSAGGVATLVDAAGVHGYEWVQELASDVVLYHSGFGKTISTLIDQHDWTRTRTGRAPVRVAFGIEPSQRQNAAANPNRGYTTVSDEELAKMMKDLRWIDLDRPALFAPYSVVDVVEGGDSWSPEAYLDTANPGAPKLAEGRQYSVPDEGATEDERGTWPSVGEGETYTHRDVAAFVLGITPSRGGNDPVYTEGLDRIPVMRTLADLLKSAGAPADFVRQQ